MPKSAKRLKLAKAPPGQTMMPFSENNQDLPLFSRTPIPVKEMPFIPTVAERQLSMFGRPTFGDLAAQVKK